MNRKHYLAPLVTLSVLLPLFSGCSRLAPATSPVAPRVAQIGGDTANTPRAGRAASSTEFSGERAFALLKAQCDFGPRPIGTAAHEKTAQFLVEQLRPLVDEATTQKWTETIRRGPGAGKTYALTNIFGLIRGESDKDKKPEDIRPALMLSAHWDTRPVADQDPNKANRKQAILGANDGASGVAALLELARVLHEKRPQQTIAFAFWDAEDVGEFFHGSRYFAKSVQSEAWKRWRPKQGILLDMIGDRDLQITRELNSVEYAPQLWEQVQAAAAQVGKSEYFNGASMDVLDDHIPLNEAGIPTIDLIDFQYPAWHTVEDTPDKCSPSSLKIVGDVVLQFIRNNGQTRV